MIRLAVALGLRRNALLRLDVEHFDGDRLWILGKGKRERRAVTVPPACLEALGDWLAARGDEPVPLFLSLARDGKRGRLAGRSLWQVVQGYGLGRVHGLRHLSVTRGLDFTNGNVRAVRQHSRHQSVDIVVRYHDARSDQAGTVGRLIDASLDA
jgi:integrase